MYIFFCWDSAGDDDIQVKGAPLPVNTKQPRNRVARTHTRARAHQPTMRKIMRRRAARP